MQVSAMYEYFRAGGWLEEKRVLDEIFRYIVYYGRELSIGHPDRKYDVKVGQKAMRLGCEVTGSAFRYRETQPAVGSRITDGCRLTIFNQTLTRTYSSAIQTETLRLGEIVRSPDPILSHLSSRLVLSELEADENDISTMYGESGFVLSIEPAFVQRAL